MDTTQVAQQVAQVPAIISYLPAVTALFAVILAPIISLHITKKQIKASVVSNARREWIDALRNDAAEYLVSITSTFMDWESARHLPSSVEDPLKKAKDNLQKAFLSGTKMRLRLNTLDQEQNELREVIGAFIIEAQKGPKIAPDKQRELSENFDSLVHSILQRQWKKVQRGE